MAKGKSRKSVLVLLLSALLLIPTIVGAFLNIFSLVEGSKTSTIISENYGIFADLSNAELSFALIGKELNSWLLLANNICLIITLFFGLILIIDLVLRMTNVKRSRLLDNIFKACTALLFISAILTLVFGLLASVCNSFVVSETLGLYQKIGLDVGFYLQIPAVLSGGLALLTFADKNTKKKK